MAKKQVKRPAKRVRKQAKTGVFPQIRTPQEIEKWYRSQAEREGRSFSNYVLRVLSNHYYEQIGKRELIEY